MQPKSAVINLKKKMFTRNCRYFEIFPHSSHIVWFHFLPASMELRRRNSFESAIFVPTTENFTSQIERKKEIAGCMLKINSYRCVLLRRNYFRRKGEKIMIKTNVTITFKDKCCFFFYFVKMKKAKG